jgi:uncharacterized RDD family membrane protein YckC
MTITDSQGRDTEGKLVEYPTILRRYFSSFIDGCLIVVSVILVPYVIGDQENTLSVRIIFAVIFLFIYEPLLTSRLCTLGQRITGIRIRRFGHYERLSFPGALFRFTIKGLLGIISFFSIIFSKDKRAIHDYASDSIVILHTDAAPQN